MIPPYGYVLASAEFAANKDAAVIMLMYVNIFFIVILFTVSYTHLTLPTIYSV